MRTTTGSRRLVTHEEFPQDVNGTPYAAFAVDRGDGHQWLEFAIRSQLAPAAERQWLWPAKIARGQVTLIQGAAGAGKSFVALDLIARTAGGHGWPGVVSDLVKDQVNSPENNTQPGRASAPVLLISRQDDEGVISDRLRQMGVNPDLVAQLQVATVCSASPEQSAKFQPWDFPQDLPLLEHELDVMPSVSLVVIDPLSDFCTTPRRLTLALRELEELARARNVAIVVTLPAQVRFDARGTLKVTSRYITDAARAVWCVAADPDEPARRLFVPQRTNGFVEPAGMAFRIQEGRVEWCATETLDPNDPLGQTTAIRACIQTVLQEGGQAASVVFRLGAQCGFTPGQMRQVSKQMGVTVRKGTGFGAEGCWVWSLDHELPLSASVLPGSAAAPVVVELAVPEAYEPAADSVPSTEPVVAGEHLQNTKSLEKPAESEASLSQRLPRDKYARKLERKRRALARRELSRSGTTKSVSRPR